MTRRGVLLPHFERVFSCPHSMQRLDWTIDPDGSLNASADGWHYEIIPHEDGVSDDRSGWWQLTCSRNGSDESKWFLARYLEDAMALATAIAAGIEIE